MTSVLLAGFGFMGRTHASVMKKLAHVKLVGVVDSRGKSVRETLQASGWEGVPVFGDLADALEHCSCDVVDICLPTDVHRDSAEMAFAAGCHVFCEKPIALTWDDAMAMVAAAERAGRELMIGHCIRFWPEYAALKCAVESGELGRLMSLSLSRRNARPDYAVGDWVNDPQRCVGAALDMHIHDTDFICHLLGAPSSVSARGIHEDTGWNSIITTYDFGTDGPLVFADGAWNYPAGWGLEMSFSAVFEHGALDFDSRSNPSMRITPVGESSKAMVRQEMPADGYHAELEYFFTRLQAGLPVENSTGAHAAESLRVVLAEIDSASQGGCTVSLSATN